MVGATAQTAAVTVLVVTVIAMVLIQDLILPEPQALPFEVVLVLIPDRKAGLILIQECGGATKSVVNLDPCLVRSPPALNLRARKREIDMNLDHIHVQVHGLIHAANLKRKLKKLPHCSIHVLLLIVMRGQQKEIMVMTNTNYHPVWKQLLALLLPVIVPLGYQRNIMTL